MSDSHAALYEIMNNLDRVISCVEGVLLKQNMPDKMSVAEAYESLKYAKAELINGLVGEEVEH